MVEPVRLHDKKWTSGMPATVCSKHPPKVCSNAASKSGPRVCNKDNAATNNQLAKCNQQPWASSTQHAKVNLSVAIRLKWTSGMPATVCNKHEDLRYAAIQQATMHVRYVKNTMPQATIN